jgi:hypothetical protein
MKKVTYPGNNHTLNKSGTLPPSVRLTIEISGIPPHLCCELIHRLLRQICTIHDITFTPATLTYLVSVHGLHLLVPSVTHIGVKKTTQHGDLLNIWPLWYETYTEEMLGSSTKKKKAPLFLTIAAPTLTGSSELDTAHRQEIHEQYYAYAGKETQSQRNTCTNSTIVQTNIVLSLTRLRRRGNLPATRYAIYTVRFNIHLIIPKNKPSVRLQLTLTYHSYILLPFFL